MEESRPNISSEEEVKRLKYYCQQLLEQNRELAQVTSLVNKLPWLFKVLEQESFFEVEFVEECVKEITEILKPENTEVEEPKKIKSNGSIKTK